LQDTSNVTYYTNTCFLDTSMFKGCDSNVGVNCYNFNSCYKIHNCPALNNMYYDSA